MEVHGSEKGYGNSAKERMLGDRGAFLEEDGNRMREYKAMHEENFLSSWLREDVEGVKAEIQRLNEESKQEESKSGKREVERE